MIIRHIKSTSHRHSAGFSMIDVLVAIVVLATALLALAALQGALTRNSADARARSQVAAYAEGLVEQLRASTGYNGIDTTAAGITLSPSSGTAAQKAAATAAQNAAGVSGLTTTIKGTLYNGAGSTFTAQAPGTTAGDSSYKQVALKTTWTDSTGQTRTLEFDTIVDSTQTNQVDQTLINKNLSLSGVSGPIVREFDPGKTAGVIPIAIGADTKTAATNPQPEVLGSKGSTISGVSFNVLTYSAPGSDNQAVIQQHVDTRVITCSCQYGAGITDTTNVLAQPYQATYWDGTKYVDPKLTSAAYSTTGQNSDKKAPPQDTYCDACCRDRNDTVSGADNTIKFDPFTTQDAIHFQHYAYDSTGALFAVPSTDTADPYLNACRMIRVNGEYRVAVDMQNYFFALLPTASTATSPIPDPAAALLYANTFVPNYLVNSIGSLAAGTGPESSTTAASDYATAGLDTPSNISLTGPTDTRYLHARGIYIDYLEPDALKAINDAIKTCPGSLSDCVLPLLPFTTINLTELANWTSSVAAVISVTPDPLGALRGVTTEVNGAKNGDTANAVAKIGVSNSGVVGNIANSAVDPYDLTVTLTDLQKFTIGGASTGGSTTLYFDVALAFSSSNWLASPTLTVVPTVKWNGSSLQLGTAVTDQKTAPWTYSSTSPASWLWYSTCVAGAKHGDPEVCSPDQVSPTIPAPVGLNISVEQYNLFTTNTGPDTATATDGSGQTCSTLNTALQCYNYPVDLTNIKVNGTLVSGATCAFPTVGGTTCATGSPPTPNGQLAKATITIPATPGISSTDPTKPDLISIGFGTPTITVSPGTCKLTKVKGKDTYVYQPATTCPQ